MMERHEAYWHLHELWSYVSEEHREALSIAMNDIEFVDLIPENMKRIVFCKDCKYLEDIEGQYPYCSCHNHECAYNNFCSYGERKDGEG